jgi:hypothetical protein
MFDIKDVAKGNDLVVQLIKRFYFLQLIDKGFQHDPCSSASRLTPVGEA